MDDRVEKRGLLGPATRRLIRSYGLLVLIALAFLFLALFVHEKDKTVPAESIRSVPAWGLEVT
jgi:hypothetical protein